MALDLHDLARRSAAELETLFRASAAGPIPEGQAVGVAILSPGTSWGRAASWLAGRLAWRGKVFLRDRDEQGATLWNVVTPFGIAAVPARVYRAASRVDGRESIVIDYSKGSGIARRVRDEIRLVDPETRLYLGRAWWGDRHFMWFGLRMQSAAASGV